MSHTSSTLRLKQARTQPAARPWRIASHLLGDTTSAALRAVLPRHEQPSAQPLCIVTSSNRDALITPGDSELSTTAIAGLWNGARFPRALQQGDHHPTNPSARLGIFNADNTSERTSGQLAAVATSIDERLFMIARLMPLLRAAHSCTLALNSALSASMGGSSRRQSPTSAASIVHSCSAASVEIAGPAGRVAGRLVAVGTVLVAVASDSGDSVLVAHPASAAASDIPVASASVAAIRFLDRNSVMINLLDELVRITSTHTRRFRHETPD
ncbi:hypothetical protein NDR87_36365 [Nocardia sp. CDC159]|nr:MULTISPECIES: hypothetical protein [Nocardia]MCM6791852.1 hypothetical protein [Nocardia sp. CDC159]